VEETHSLYILCILLDELLGIRELLRLEIALLILRDFGLKDFLDPNNSIDMLVWVVDGEERAWKPRAAISLKLQQWLLGLAIHHLKHFFGSEMEVKILADLLP
jgi:hypothetical protein